MAINLRQSQDVKHHLHKEVFHPNRERLVAFMKVSKTEPSFLSKTENVHYLCCSVSIKRPPKAFVCRYRKANNGESYEERRRWPLEELKVVDGHSDSTPIPQFDLHFDRPFKFEACSVTEKEEFLENLASLALKYLDKAPPTFENVSSKIQTTLSSTHSLMSKNKQHLVERGEKIPDLEQNTSEMADSAKNFHETARELAKHYKN